MPRIAYVNKMDRTGADFPAVVDAMKNKLGAAAVPIQIPWGSEETFRGVIDLINNQAIGFPSPEQGEEPERSPLPADFQEPAERARNVLLEALAEHDDGLLTEYLDGRKVGGTRIKEVLRRCTLAGRLFPSSAARRSGTSAPSRCWTRSSTFFPRPRTCRRCGYLTGKERRPRVPRTRTGP